MLLFMCFCCIDDVILCLLWLTDNQAFTLYKSAADFHRALIKMFHHWASGSNADIHKSMILNQKDRRQQTSITSVRKTLKDKMKQIAASTRPFFWKASVNLDKSLCDKKQTL